MSAIVWGSEGPGNLVALSWNWDDDDPRKGLDLVDFIYPPNVRQWYKQQSQYFEDNCGVA
jgi:hypothetical protein